MNKATEKEESMMSRERPVQTSTWQLFIKGGKGFLTYIRVWSGVILIYMWSKNQR